MRNRRLAPREVPRSRRGLPLAASGAALVCVLSIGATAAAATLRVEITNVANKKGSLRIAVHDEANWLRRAVVSRAVSVDAASDESVTVTFDVEPGRLAVSVHHDVDGNGKMDRNLLGIPKEPYGFSGSAGRFGPPRFEKASFDVESEPMTVGVKLRD